jgi:hypothetical protein
VLEQRNSIENEEEDEDDWRMECPPVKRAGPRC